MTLIEICVDDAGGVRAAREGGADRVELCRDLSCGGLTPDFGLVEEALDQAPTGGLQVLVRPRPGDFVHTGEEVARIGADIRALARLGSGARVPLGFVVGVLEVDGTLNESACRRLRDEAGDAPLTFHRAFDAVPDQEAALERLIDWGYDRVLTTGGHPAVAQTEALRALVDQAGDRIGILVSGGLRSTNVAGIAAASCAREVHLRAPAPQGAACGTDIDEVRRIVAALDATATTR